jgi:hypothetical protein
MTIRKDRRKKTYNEVQDEALNEHESELAEQKNRNEEHDETKN